MIASSTTSVIGFGEEDAFELQQRNWEFGSASVIHFTFQKYFPFEKHSSKARFSCPLIQFYHNILFRYFVFIISFSFLWHFKFETSEEKSCHFVEEWQSFNSQQHCDPIIHHFIHPLSRPTDYHIAFDSSSHAAAFCCLIHIVRMSLSLVIYCSYQSEPAYACWS